MSAIYSMTGYASLRGSVKEQLAFALTIKSVNHRFLDCSSVCRHRAMGWK